MLDLTFQAKFGILRRVNLLKKLIFIKNVNKIKTWFSPKINHKTPSNRPYILITLPPYKKQIKCISSLLN